MNALEIGLLAAGLSVDGALVALTHGLAARDRRTAAALRIALVFGASHGALATAGWWCGTPIAGAFEQVDHWIAFALLCGIAVHTIREGHEERSPGTEPSWTRVLVASAATGVDAFAAGFGLRLIEEPIAPVALSTGTVTALGALAAYSAAARVPEAWRRRAHWIAGLVLIAIGVRVLVDHAGHM